MTTPPNDLRIGRYTVIRGIGQGGLGTFFLARDPVIDRQVVIKTFQIHDARELAEQLVRGALEAGRLTHPNIVSVFEAGEHDGEPFVAMEYMQGETLADVIRRRSPLPLPQKLSLIEQLCDGLEHAHRAGIRHGDIKPANLIIGPGPTLKIREFGWAAVRAGRPGCIIGTLNYLAPELIKGLPGDARSDLFAAGLTAYELLTYTQAFPGKIDDGVLVRLETEPPPPVVLLCPGITPAIPAILERALEKDPARRYQTAADMRNDLEEVRRRLETTDDEEARRREVEEERNEAADAANRKAALAKQQEETGARQARDEEARRGNAEEGPPPRPRDVRTGSADIFLSYARKDVDRARALAQALEAEGWSVFWDIKIPPGRSYEEHLESMLQGARAVVVLWSPSSVGSDWVKMEAAHARERKILIPALIARAEIPFWYRHLQAADLCDWPAGASEGFGALVASLKNLLTP